MTRSNATAPRHGIIAACGVVLAGAIAAAILLKQRSIDAQTRPHEPERRTAYSRQAGSGRLKIAAREVSLDWIVAELEVVDAETDIIKRDERLDLVIGALEPENVAAVLELLHTQQTSTSLGTGLRLLRRWAEQDAASAAEWMTNLSVADRRDGIVQVAIAWADRELDAATTWAKSLAEAERENALLHIADRAVRTHPKQAFGLARELASGEARDNVLLHAAAEIAATGNAETALTAANEVIDESLHERLLSAIFATWAATDPSAAATEAAQRLPTRRPQENAVIGIVQRWKQTDPAAASAWVNSFPDGELRRTAQAEMEELR